MEEAQRKREREKEREGEKNAAKETERAYNDVGTSVQPRMRFIGPMAFIVHRTADGSKETATMRNPVQLNGYCLHISESIHH